MRCVLLSLCLFFLCPVHAQDTPANVKNPKTRIVVLGDSIAAGYGVDKEKAFPALLEKSLLAKKKKVEVVNAGISGSTTASALGRLKWLSKRKIDILILELGGNDGLRGISVESSKKNLVKTIQLAKEKKIEVLLTGMKLPQNYGKQYRADFEQVFKTIAQEQKIKFMPFLLKDVGGEESLNLADGIHPNEKGHEIIAKNLLPYVEKML